MDQVSPRNITTGLQILYAGYFLYNCGISIAKFSTLFFYARVFDISKRFRIALYIVGAQSVLWLFVFLIVDIFHIPMHADPKGLAYQP